MSVLFIGRTHLLTFLILNTIVVYYATAAEATQHPQKQRQNFNEAEINSGKTPNGKIFNGKEAKTAATRRLPESHLNSGFKKNYEVSAAPPSRRASIQFSQRNQANRKVVAFISKSETSANHSTSSRRYHSRQEPPSPAQLSTQYEIPREHRDRVDSQKGQQRSRSRHESARTLPLQTSQVSASLLAQANGSSNVKKIDSSQNENISASGRSPLKKLSRVRMTTTTTTTLAPTTTTPRNEFLENIPQNMPFNFVPNYFWKLSGPPAASTSTKKPPKKFKPTIATLSDSFQRSKHVTTAHKITPDNSPKHYNDDDGPFRIALPTINFLNSSMKPSAQDNEREKGKRATVQALRERFNCPRESEVRFQLFPKICKVDKDCKIWNRDELCCEIFGAKSCVTGVPKPLEETSHTPILGLIPRKCPTRPLAELWWDVKECDTDNDCWPRVCCPDGRRRYCRTSEPELEVVPTPVKRSFNYLTEYLECTPPPPPIFDLHPKACISTFDCFPNVCCQEAGLRHCRPPKKSVLTLMANFLNVGFVKRLTQNIVIK